MYVLVPGVCSICPSEGSTGGNKVNGGERESNVNEILLYVLGYTGRLPPIFQV